MSVVAAAAVVSILAMTWLFPLLSAAVTFTKKLRRRSSRARALKLHICRTLKPIRKVSILIPVHNESRVLRATITSILSAIDFLARFDRQRSSQVHFRVVVGADGCSDESAKVAKDLGVDVIESEVRSGKWATLNQLVRHCSSSDWFIAVDAGTIWPKTFLQRVILHFQSPEIMAVAPAYRGVNDGSFEKLLWKFESHLKNLENFSGGPVTVHGATVCYRSRELLRALSELNGSNWNNDDVVMPLVLRAVNPKKRILYLSDIQVRECRSLSRSGMPEKREFARRKRMMLGNLQWIMQLWIPFARRNFTAALLATRRVFRLLWAYWLALTVIAVALKLQSDFGIQIEPLTFIIFAGAALAIALYYRFSRWLVVLRDGALASIISPFYLFAFHGQLKADSLGEWR